MPMRFRGNNDAHMHLIFDLAIMKTVRAMLSSRSVLSPIVMMPYAVLDDRELLLNLWERRLWDSRPATTLFLNPVVKQMWLGAYSITQASVLV